jgi:hypothetical protein
MVLFHNPAMGLTCRICIQVINCLQFHPVVFYQIVHVKWSFLCKCHYLQQPSIIPLCLALELDKLSSNLVVLTMQYEHQISLLFLDGGTWLWILPCLVSRLLLVLYLEQINENSNGNCRCLLWVGWQMFLRPKSCSGMRVPIIHHLIDHK